MSVVEHVPNIGDRGARGRFISGIVWLVIAVALLVALLLTDAPRWARLLLAIPAALAATGFLEARERT